MKFTWRIWLMLVFLTISLIAIFVDSNGITFLQSGLLVKDIGENSSLLDFGLKSGMTITGINGVEIKSISDYNTAIQDYYLLKEGETKKIEFQIKHSDSIIALVEKDTLSDISLAETSKTRISPVV